MSLLKDGRLVDGVSPLPMQDVTQSSENVSVTGETVTFANGVAGTTQQIKLVNDGVMNSTGSNLGKRGDSSIAWTTGTVLTTEVAWKFKGDPQNDNDTFRLATMSNGDYMVDYENGYILGKNATTTSSSTDTIAYKVRMRTVLISSSGASGATDIEGVTAKNAPVTEKPVLLGMEYEALGAITTDAGTAGDKVPWKAGATGIPYVALTNVAGTKQLALLEDAAHASGDAGIQMLAVRSNTLAALAGTTGDYSPLQVNTNGALYVTGPVKDDAAFTVGTNYGFPMFALADETSTDSVDENDVGAVRMTLTRKLFTAACQIHDAVASGYINVMGATARAAQQTAVAAADAVGLVTNLFGELVIAGYDWASGTIKTTEADPLDTHYVNNDLVDTTNVSAATHYYPSSTGGVMDTYADLSCTGKFIDADGTLTLTLQVSNDEDSTNADWNSVYFYDDELNATVNTKTVTNGTELFTLSCNNNNFRRYRWVVVASGATNTVILKERKKAL